MTPSAEQRDAVFRAFGRAFFKQDLDAMYEVVTPDFTWTLLANGTLRTLDTREKVAAFFVERKTQVESVRFADVVYHHAPDASFMTFRMTGTDKATGQPFTCLCAAGGGCRRLKLQRFLPPASLCAFEAAPTALTISKMRLRTFSSSIL
jgi:ketosteroid isomerase-like protein